MRTYAKTNGNIEKLFARDDLAWECIDTDAYTADHKRVTRDFVEYNLRRFYWSKVKVSDTGIFEVIIHSGFWFKGVPR